MKLRNRMLRAAAGAGAAPPVLTDPQFNYVSLLLNDTGTNGQQNNTFLDSSTNNFTITRNGTPTQGSFSPYGDLWSNQFSGSGQYLTVPYNTAMLPESGTNFTAECWVYLTGATAAFQFILGMNSSTQSNWSIKNENGTLQGGIGNASGNFGSTTANTWVHLAITQNSNTLVGFLNGTQVFSQAITSWTSTSLAVSVGARSSAGDRAFPGYISNVRIVKGTAVYTSNFTPSTTPLTAVSGTSLLTCQSNRFKDNSSNNFAITVTGAPTVQAFEPFEPSASYATSVGGSGYFNGTSDFLTVPTSTSFDQSGDFTIEAWIYLTAAPASGVTIGGAIYSQESPSTRLLKLSVYNNLKVAVTQAGVGQVFISTQTLALFTWYHVALVKNGSGTNNIKLYINGINDGSGTKTDPGASTTTSYIGREAYTGTGTIYFPGYMSNWRFVKGTAVYTANFTPPTSPVTAITNTSLLLNFTNAGIYDAATLNDLVTVGDAQVSTAQAKWGGSSMAFDGTGDNLSASGSDLHNLPGDFTVEGWIYTTSTAAQRIVGKWNGTSNVAWLLIVNPGGSVIQWGIGNSGTFQSAPTFSATIATNTWHHVAVTRSGSTIRAFLNGIQAGSSTTSTANLTAPNTNALTVGQAEGINYFTGYLEDIRITKGYARYTANFTPPTTPFPTR